jgi:hypothetical protein
MCSFSFSELHAGDIVENLVQRRFLAVDLADFMCPDDLQEAPIGSQTVQLELLATYVNAGAVFDRETRRPNLALSASGESSAANLPATVKQTRSQSSSTSYMLCVVRTTVFPGCAAV